MSSALPVANTDIIHPESELFAETPLVDSTNEVTTTTNHVDDDAHQHGSETVTQVVKRPIEREDGEISDDEPDSVSTNVPPDSSGISSSSSYCDQLRAPPFQGFRGGAMMMSYRPRFLYRGRFPRGRGFFRGRGFAPWWQWYDQPLSRDRDGRDDEHMVDSSGIRSPQTETTRKKSVSSRSPVHSPISSTDDECEDDRHTKSDHHRSKSDRHDRPLRSKQNDHPVADSTRTSVVHSPELEPSSDSDKEPASHSSASKKKVCCLDV